MSEVITLEQSTITAIAAANEHVFKRHPNYDGYGVGLFDVDGVHTLSDGTRYKNGITVFVTENPSMEGLSAAQRVPEIVDGVPVKLELSLDFQFGLDEEDLNE